MSKLEWIKGSERLPQDCQRVYVLARNLVKEINENGIEVFDIYK